MYEVSVRPNQHNENLRIFHLIAHGLPSESHDNALVKILNVGDEPQDITIAISPPNGIVFVDCNLGIEGDAKWKRLPSDGDTENFQITGIAPKQCFAIDIPVKLKGKLTSSQLRVIRFIDAWNKRNVGHPDFQSGCDVGIGTEECKRTDLAVANRLETMGLLDSQDYDYEQGKEFWLTDQGEHILSKYDIS